ncbi:hypothetical protein H2203_006977 [Taxawa tesnikishii (nom. ined.)]|nr:hypothetical protein H2203_006977 [Dothideales sp. JES 119]
MQTLATRKNWAKCHPQSQSPLFAKLPAELLNKVFDFALTPHEDSKSAYSPEAWYYRPGYHAPLRVPTSLLLTCRQAWLIGNHIPLSSTTLSDWFFRGPASRLRSDRQQQPTTALSNSRHRLWDMLDRMTYNNLSNINSIHYFAQLFWIEALSANPDSLTPFFGPPPPSLCSPISRVTTITIRHTDWQEWDIDTPLKFNDAWLRAILNDPRRSYLQSFRLQLETLTARKQELDTIVDRLRQLEGTALLDGNELLRFTADETVKIVSWTGTSHINGQTWASYSGSDSISHHSITIP